MPQNLACAAAPNILPEAPEKTSTDTLELFTCLSYLLTDCPYRKKFAGRAILKYASGEEFCSKNLTHMLHVPRSTPVALRLHIALPKRNEVAHCRGSMLVCALPAVAALQLHVHYFLFTNSTPF